VRFFLRILLFGCLALAGLAAFTFASDEVWARIQGRPVEQIKVDRVYAVLDRWNRVEYSVGTPVIETCIDALMPHFGYVPCWYLQRHTLREIRNP